MRARVRVRVRGRRGGDRGGRLIRDFCRAGVVFAATFPRGAPNRGRADSAKGGRVAYLTSSASSTALLVNSVGDDADASWARHVSALAAACSLCRNFSRACDRAWRSATGGARGARDPSTANPAVDSRRSRARGRRGRARRRRWVRERSGEDGRSRRRRPGFASPPTTRDHPGRAARQSLPGTPVVARPPRAVSAASRRAARPSPPWRASPARLARILPPPPSRGRRRASLTSPRSAASRAGLLLLANLLSNFARLRSSSAARRSSAARAACSADSAARRRSSTAAVRTPLGEIHPLAKRRLLILRLERVRTQSPQPFVSPRQPCEPPR